MRRKDSRLALGLAWSAAVHVAVPLLVWLSALALWPDAAPPPAPTSPPQAEPDAAPPSGGNSRASTRSDGIPGVRFASEQPSRDAFDVALIQVPDQLFTERRQVLPAPPRPGPRDASGRDVVPLVRAPAAPVRLAALDLKADPRLPTDATLREVQRSDFSSTSRQGQPVPPSPEPGRAEGRDLRDATGHGDDARANLLPAHPAPFSTGTATAGPSSPLNGAGKDADRQAALPKVASAPATQPQPPAPLPPRRDDGKDAELRPPSPAQVAQTGDGAMDQKKVDRASPVQLGTERGGALFVASASAALPTLESPEHRRVVPARDEVTQARPAAALPPPRPEVQARVPAPLAAPEPEDTPALVAASSVAALSPPQAGAPLPAPGVDGAQGTNPNAPAESSPDSTTFEPGTPVLVAMAAQPSTRAQMLERIAASMQPLGGGAGLVPGLGDLVFGDDNDALVTARISHVASLFVGKAAMRRHGKREARIQFHIDPRGYVQDVRLQQGTRVRELDSAIEYILHLAEPFPAHTGGREYDIVLPFEVSD